MTQQTNKQMSSQIQSRITHSNQYRVAKAHFACINPRHRWRCHPRAQSNSISVSDCDFDSDFSQRVQYYFGTPSHWDNMGSCVEFGAGLNYRYLSGNFDYPIIRSSIICHGWKHRSTLGQVDEKRFEKRNDHRCQMRANKFSSLLLQAGIAAC